MKNEAWEVRYQEDGTAEFVVRVDEHLLRTESVGTLEKIVGYGLYRAILKAKRECFVRPSGGCEADASQTVAL